MSVSSARDLMDGFAAQDARLAANRVTAGALRDERAELMKGWTALVQGHDFDAISARAMRLAEIDRELVKLGV